jgi:hypothetical protein
MVQKIAMFTLTNDSKHIKGMSPEKVREIYEEIFRGLPS